MHIDALELGRDLIRCPSITPFDAGALDVLRDALEPLGFTCARLVFSDDRSADVANLYARLGDDQPNFCFAGHTDVVPVGDEKAWTVDPFAAEIRDGRLYGRGASDMKAAIACFAAAVSRFLARRDQSLNGSISFLITGDEEGPAINGTVKVLDWLRRRGEVLDACLVGEPTNPSTLGEMIKIGRRGSLNFALTMHGIQGHAAYPHLADNPIPRLIRALGAMVETPLDEGTAHFDPSVLTVTSIDVGNKATNVIPATAKALFNIRFNDLHTPESLTAWVRARCEDTNGRFDLETEGSGSAFLCPPGHLSDVVVRAVEQVTGIRPVLSTSGGTSDARFIKNACPVCEFGMPGETAHKVDENVAVSDIQRLTEIYEAVLDGFFAAPACRQS
ncbi:MAG: succinyl-diaminopimelate desuccinylase [Rhodospirillales bacterium]|nr:succinyl-diaminopimelate desuccinylase [Rhodospirillales bacterium]